MRRAMWAIALFALALTTACTSSAGSPSSGPTAGDTSQDTTSAAPPPDTSTPTTAAPSSTPPTTKPPQHQTDPGLQALRAWAAEAARTVNAGHFDSAPLDKLMTAGFRSHMKAVLGNSVGYRYPGPIPFTAKSVHPAGANQRQIDVCFVSNGYAVSKKTGKPKGQLQVTALDARVQRTHGRWLVAALYNGSFSCKGVHIRKAA